MAIDRIKQGLEPVPPPVAPEPTVTDLAERYMEAHVRVNCRPATVEAFGRLLRLYVVPELGHLRLSEVDRAQVSELHHKLREKPYQANAAVGVLANMFRLAEAWGMTPPRRNPCRSVRRYREARRERFLTPEEYRELGRVLDEAEADGSVFPPGGPRSPSAAAHGLPPERGPDAQVGRRGPRGGGASAEGRQDGMAQRAAHAGGGGGACGNTADEGQPLGDRGAEARKASHQPGCHLDEAPQAGEGSKTCVSTTAVTRTPLGRWRWARGFR